MKVIKKYSAGTSVDGLDDSMLAAGSEAYGAAYYRPRNGKPQA